MSKISVSRKEGLAEAVITCMREGCETTLIVMVEPNYHEKIARTGRGKIRKFCHPCKKAGGSVSVFDTGTTNGNRQVGQKK